MRCCSRSRCLHREGAGHPRKNSEATSQVSHSPRVERLKGEIRGSNATPLLSTIHHGTLAVSGKPHRSCSRCCCACSACSAMPFQLPAAAFDPNGYVMCSRDGRTGTCCRSSCSCSAATCTGSTHCDEHAPATSAVALMQKRAADTVRKQNEIGGACSARSRSLLCVAASASSASFSRAFTSSASRACRKSNANERNGIAAVCHNLARWRRATAALWQSCVYALADRRRRVSAACAKCCWCVQPFCGGVAEPGPLLLRLRVAASLQPPADQSTARLRSKATFGSHALLGDAGRVYSIRPSAPRHVGAGVFKCACALVCARACMCVPGPKKMRRCGRCEPNPGADMP
jgi:hypothetical protein